MKCAWQAFLNLLPPDLREETDRLGRNSLIELRLRLGQFPELCLPEGGRFLHRKCSRQDLDFCINTASAYSPWSAGTLSQGYLTGEGGHRIGVCGQAVVKSGQFCGISAATSLCIRTARDFPGISGNLGHRASSSLLIIGPPGSGKTTFLRDLVRTISCDTEAFAAVVDEKEEIFPRYKGEFCFPTGPHTDILSGCSKREGIEALLRNMGPTVIAVDEITAREDCEALIHGAWCGVRLIATAHASSLEDLYTRPVYAPLIKAPLFDRVVILRRDKTWKEERMIPCKRN